MRIQETITPTNANKTVLGKKEIELTLDTETGEIDIDAPAMFVNPVVKLVDLKEAIDKLESLYLNHGSNQG